jgi:peptidoglycan/xylan/chitin deacetylase (PgdA/CDA1 family)
MNRYCREIALTVYRWATCRNRAKFVRSFERNGTYPASILFYHRVSDHSPNDWSMSVRNFRRQMQWIANHAAPASLDSIYHSQAQACRNKPMVGVTFDDGYAENMETALPILLQYKIPSTYFVTTHFVETGDPFPHDVRVGQSLRPNTISQIRTLAEHGIQIGAHSHSHVDFGKTLSERQLKTEIHDVRKKLQDWSGQSIDYFAFPFGLKCNISQQSIDAIYHAGYRAFVSAAGGMNLPGQDPFHLQRLHGDPGFAAFLNWLTFDPRKVKRICPITYRHPSVGSLNKSPDGKAQATQPC